MPHTVSGQDIAIVGFIPQIPDPSNQPAAYRDSRPDPWKLGMDFLFKSGNPTPTVASEPNLYALIKGKEFRGVIALRNLSVTWPDRQGPAIFQYSAPLLIPGYTPVRLWYNNGRAWYHRHIWYSLGAGITDVAHVATEDLATIELKLKIKLSWFMNAAQAALTYHLAPWAVMHLRYTLHRDGTREIEVIGSEIPSQQIIVDWQIVHFHDMAAIAPSDATDFICAGNCLDAPISTKCAIN